MPLFTRISGTYKNANVHVRSAGAYVPVYQVYIKTGGGVATCLVLLLDNW